MIPEACVVQFLTSVGLAIVDKRFEKTGGADTGDGESVELGQEQVILATGVLE